MRPTPHATGSDMTDSWPTSTTSGPGVLMAFKDPVDRCPTDREQICQIDLPSCPSHTWLPECLQRRLAIGLTST
jgi:hypothetical protein